MSLLTTKHMRIYILGVSGLLGSELFLRFNNNKLYNVRGSCRSLAGKNYIFFEKYLDKIDDNLDANNIKNIKKNIIKFNPDVVINCVGFVKQKIKKKFRPDEIFYINSFFPKKIYSITKSLNKRLVHFSTDCVFDGKRGNYSEQDKPSAKDIYGLSKCRGELKGKKVITIRTSVIGHEVSSKNGLLEWFLNQKKSCLGFANCYFSGLTSYEIYNFISRYLLKSEISGLIHLSSSPISKFKLLKIISSVYKKKILIKKDLKLKINRVLNSNLIKKKLLYKAPSWTRMIKEMYKNKK